MANNRMLLVHKPTGRAFVLAKYYPSTGWFSRRHSMDLERWCADLGRVDWDYGEDFELLYETQVVYTSHEPLMVEKLHT